MRTWEYEHCTSRQKMRVCSVKLISDHSLAAGRGIESLLILSAVDPPLMARLIPSIRKEGEMPFNEIPSEKKEQSMERNSVHFILKDISFIGSANLGPHSTGLLSFTRREKETSSRDNTFFIDLHEKITRKQLQSSDAVWLLLWILCLGCDYLPYPWDVFAHPCVYTRAEKLHLCNTFFEEKSNGTNLASLWNYLWPSIPAELAPKADYSEKVPRGRVPLLFVLK